VKKVNSMMVGKPYVASTLSPQIRKFLGSSLRGLDNEINQLFQRTKWAKKDLFEYNERALVGLLNNAIVRHDKGINTFEEYHVYKGNEKLIGRADLLVMHEDFDLLVEAKRWVYDGRECEDKDCTSLFKRPMAQLQRYYKAEKNYFAKKHTFLGVLIFEYVSQKYIEKVRRQYDGQSEPEKGIDFDTVYLSENNGLMVYGQVFQTSEA
jgi:hypothetical protein